MPHGHQFGLDTSLYLRKRFLAGASINGTSVNRRRLRQRLLFRCRHIRSGCSRVELGNGTEEWRGGYLSHWRPRRRIWSDGRFVDIRWMIGRLGLFVVFAEVRGRRGLSGVRHLGRLLGRLRWGGATGGLIRTGHLLANRSQRWDVFVRIYLMRSESSLDFIRAVAPIGYASTDSLTLAVGFLPLFVADVNPIN